MGFKLYTRADCGLCEEMLATLLDHTGLPLTEFELIDIDSRPELRALYGSRIPVLERSGVELAAGCISEQQLAQLSQ